MSEYFLLLILAAIATGLSLGTFVLILLMWQKSNFSYREQSHEFQIMLQSLTFKADHKKSRNK